MITPSLMSILVVTLDGTPLAAGKAVLIVIQARGSLAVPHVYLAADAQRPSWTEVPVGRNSNTIFTVNTVKKG